MLLVRVAYLFSLSDQSSPANMLGKELGFSAPNPFLGSQAHFLTKQPGPPTGLSDRAHVHGPTPSRFGAPIERSAPLPGLRSGQPIS
jgi:hypothetical protein